MGKVHYFLWLAGQAVNNALFLVPALLLLTVAAAAAILCWQHGRVWPFRAAAWLLCAPTLVTLLILVCGTLFAAVVRMATDAPAPRCVVGLFVLDLTGIACLAWWFRRFWMVVFPLAMAQAWFACLAAAISYMSVTCDWL